MAAATSSRQRPLGRARPGPPPARPSAAPARRPTAAKRSGSQRLAAPKAAPGLRPIQPPGDRAGGPRASDQCAGARSDASGGGHAQSDAREHRAIVVHLAAAPNRGRHARAPRQQRPAARRWRSPSARERRARRSASAEPNEFGKQHARRRTRPRSERRVRARVRGVSRTASTSATAPYSSATDGRRAAPRGAPAGSSARRSRTRGQRQHDVAEPVGRAHAAMRSGAAHAVAPAGAGLRLPAPMHPQPLLRASRAPSPR